MSSTTKIHRLEENIGALQVKITKEEDADIRKIINSITIVGGRYPAMPGVDVDAGLYGDSPPLNA